MSFKPMKHGAHCSQISPPFTSLPPLIPLHYPDTAAQTFRHSLKSFWLPLVLYTALYGSSRSTTIYSCSKTVATYICSSYTVTYSLFECVRQLRIILYRRAPEFAFRPHHEPLCTPWLWFSSLFNITTIMRSSIRHSINTNTITLHATKPQKYQ